ncbi:hypothetical protein SAMN05216191_114117 [Paenibacillus jilunlii]|uniref:Uncharacterized protein n=1 Tax=Paenibacillus jilunlii TaxID=682956 RepID=A0A1G9UD63_9BACL|nr:hypothetical protein SAMN05216191_114117 [Paenibacillus jilunlii]
MLKNDDQQFLENVLLDGCLQRLLEKGNLFLLGINNLEI